MSLPVNIQLQRFDLCQPWGFRLQGGRDFRQELSIKKVSAGTPAEGRLYAGDQILAISGYNASQLTHSDASRMISQSGNVLQMTLKRAEKQLGVIKPTGPVKFKPSAAYGYR